MNLLLVRLINFLTGNTGDVYGVYPNQAAATSVTSGAPNVKGTWVQVVNSTTEDVIIRGFEVATIAGLHQVDVGLGASGSEVVAASFPATSTGRKPIDLFIPKGSRLSLRSSSVAGAQAITVYTFYSTMR